MPPMSMRVICALRIFGNRNACTPFEIASTPVSAEHPLAKERRSSRMTPACVSDSPSTVKPADSATGGSPSIVRVSPTTTMTKTLPMNR